MTPSTRLTTLLAVLAAGPLLVGCGPLDDEACLSVGPADECPSDEAAANQLIGNETCTSPVRKVTRTGTLVSETFVDAHEGTYGPVEAHVECCYEAAYREKTGVSCVVGRPVRAAGEAQTAPVMPRGDWLSASQASPNPTADAVLAAQWREDAALEHASVAAFARLTLELLALGAPADLVQRATQAQLDEVDHAAGCYALAASLDGQSMGPGPLPLPARDGIDLVTLAVESFEEGCVGETLAVCRAAVQLQGNAHPEARALLERIVADEQRHAALAWDIVAWALRTGGAPVEQALRDAAARIVLPTEALADAPAWALKGAFEQAWAEVITPSLDALLG